MLRPCPLPTPAARALLSGRLLALRVPPCPGSSSSPAGFLRGCTPPGACDAPCATIGAGLLGAPRALAGGLARGGLPRTLAGGLARGGLTRGLTHGLTSGGLFFVLARRPGLATPPDDSLSGRYLPPEYAVHQG